MIFDQTGDVVAFEQMEHRQICTQPGWCEHDPEEIWRNTKACIDGAMSKAGLEASDISAIGITNQRETTVVWNRKTGKPFCNALVWMDMRSQQICEDLISAGGADQFRETTGLPVSPYFSGTKLKWMLNNIPGLREGAEKGDLVFGK